MLDQLRWKKFPVLNDGFVSLVDVMGDDSSIVQAARVSYGTGTKKTSDDRTLVRYLMRHRHTTPFEMVELKFLVRVPMDCWRQWIRHRTASVNEYSTRYSEAIDSQQVTSPDEWRCQAASNKQGSCDGELHWPNGKHPDAVDCTFSVGDYLSQREQSVNEFARTIYQERLDCGVAREQARKGLPLSTYTEAYWKIDLHNLFHFLSLRMDSHAQLEIRSYANVIGREIVAKLLPISWEAFEDYRLSGMFLTRLDQRMIEVVTNNSDIAPPYSVGHFIQWQSAEWVGLDRCRERDECLAKLQRLGIIAKETS